MSNLEDELRDLREKNSDLAKEVQNLKILTAQKDKEKLELTKENNELRLKISRLRSGGAAQARKLDAGLQSASEEALSHLVQASGAVTRTLQLAKQYMQERQELDLSSPRWSYLSSSNDSTKKVNEVPPLLLGGQSIQPVVSLSRTMLHNRSINRSPNPNTGVTHRPLPMHMLLQDVYIPLTRIDAPEIQSNTIEAEENVGEGENSAEDLGLEDSIEQPVDAEESQNLSTVSELEETRGLDAVMEESAELEERAPSPPRLNRETVVLDNPLEGPSWLLDVDAARENAPRACPRVALEPDSTTPCETPVQRRQETPSAQHNEDEDEKENAPLATPLFSPTVRRRKRTSSPPRPSFSPRPPRKHSTARILKVVVAKMRLSDSDGGSGDSSPPKRPALEHSPQTPRAKDRTDSPRRSAIEPPGSTGGSRRSTVDGRELSQIKEGLPRFDAPSPNGATDAGVIVCESNQPLRSSPRPRTSRSHSRASSRSQSRSRDHSRSDSRMEYSDSDHADDTRTRRTRKQVSYKEKPLNRKLRR